MATLFIMIVLATGQAQVGYNRVPAADCNAKAEHLAGVLLDTVAGATSVSTACVVDGNRS